MTKSYEYRGYSYIIEIILNTRAEKRIDGEKWHTIILCGTPAEKQEEVRDKYLEITLEDFERFAKKYVDKIIDGVPPATDRLSKLGFTMV